MAKLRIFTAIDGSLGHNIFKCFVISRFYFLFGMILRFFSKIFYYFRGDY